MELAAANAEIARRVRAHGKTLDALAAEHGFSEGSLDFVFVDHDKDAYVPDLVLESTYRG